MDDKLTRAIQDYLDANPGDRDLIAGATLMLKLNHNKILFQNVLRKPAAFAGKIEYELKKYQKMRIDEKTADDVIKLDAIVTPEAQVLLSEALVISSDDDTSVEAKVAKGIRADHDLLPANVQALWEDSKSVYFKIKELYNQLKTMNNAPACDRYEYLKQLKELDEKYRDNMKLYDGYDANVPQPYDGDDFEDAVTDPAEVAKKVSAARKYLSVNKVKLADLKNSDKSAYSALLAKVQERYDYLIGTGNVVDEAQTSELASLGIKTVEKALAQETANETEATEQADQ
jgi:hypothetical protein